jgi:hypothetical protein
VKLPGGFVLMRFGAILEVRFDGVGGGRRVPRPSGRAALIELAQLSRYPFGLSAEQLARLLASANQPQLIEVRP